MNKMGPADQLARSVQIGCGVSCALTIGLFVVGVVSIAILAILLQGGV